jgi:peptide chain release factor 3
MTTVRVHDAQATLRAEIERRRTFAIISHPDAGKTTLTEKLLLHSGALQEAGAVRVRRQARATTSDWMELERRRGISISSTVIRFEHRGRVLNLLDTPGHADFGEDAYRALYAADFALLLLDAAKGLEERTLRLFRVCRERRLPIVSFVNKCDRPALAPLAILDELRARLGLVPVPLSWPVADGSALTGIVDRRTGELVRLEATPHGASLGVERRGPLDRDGLPPDARRRLREELELLEVAGQPFRRRAFLAGQQTPLLFGSARANDGVRMLLELLLELAPSPGPRADVAGVGRSLEEPFSALVFKVQTNMDPRHRDRAAFLRLMSGRFHPGASVIVARTGRTLRLRTAHTLFGRARHAADEAVAGDVIAVVNARGLRLGDTLYSGPAVVFPPLPAFPPERFAIARNRDVRRYKQFRRGLARLAEEGALQRLTRVGVGGGEVLLGAVGELALDVAQFRLEHEFGCQVELEPAPWRLALEVSPPEAALLDGRYGVELVRDEAGRTLALARSEHQLRGLAEPLDGLDARLPIPSARAG